MQETGDPYKEFLRARADKTFYRLPYPGNAGDSLIQFATARLLDKLHIATTVDPRKADVILVPGGNPSMWPSIGAQRWRELWTRYPRAEFVVGPAGFRPGCSEWANAVKKEGVRVSGLFARDPESFDQLAAASLGGITHALSHDVTLSLRASDWLKAHLQAASADYVLMAFRNDFEANLRFEKLMRALRKTLPGRLYEPLARGNALMVRRRKIAAARRALGDGVPMVVSDASTQRFEVFVETIRAARAVHTDRLHVMLLAAMLEKRVFAYSTAHAKLEGVYYHSLAGWADVTLVKI